MASAAFASGFRVILTRDREFGTAASPQASISPESFETSARRGWNVQLATPFTYRTYRERWMDALEENCGRYDALCREHGRDPKAMERMLLVPFFVDEDPVRARDLYGPRVEWFYAKVTANQLAGAPAVVPGYELTMTEGRRTRELGYLTFEQLHKHGAAIADDPETCVEKLREMKRRFGLTELTLWFNVGGIDPALCERAMRLTMERVIPYV